MGTSPANRVSIFFIIVSLIAIKLRFFVLARNLMWPVVNIGEITHDGYVICKTKAVNFQIFNILLMHFPVFWMHRSSRYSRWLLRIILEQRIYESTSRIHDSRNAFAAEVQVAGMV